MAGVRAKAFKRHQIAPIMDAWWMRATALPLALLLLLFVIPTVNPQMDDIEADASEVKIWALRFGKAISEGSAEATCLRKIEENFVEHGAKVEWVEVPQMLEEMRLDVKNMLRWKKEAVERIAQEAQVAASSHQNDDTLKFEYYNAKKLYDSDESVNKDGWRRLEMSTHHNFDVPVNTIHSSIHVPTNVHDKGSKLVNAVKWSEALNKVFRNNLAADPSIYWQYFGSDTGFLRMFPGSKWPKNIEAEENLDSYDCRMRSWYIQAAASAKDIVILIDNSASMTGIRREIANNVAVTILDTLSENDFVTVMRFSSEVDPLVPCFGDALVQATARNIREFKEHLCDNETAEIANFTKSLTKAFELLQKYNRSRLGSQCNQAIMLVTDGAPETYEEIFSKYNWPNIPVRVFTYLVGIEVTEINEVNFMACRNRGYFTHVASSAEVQEEVQKYIPVMSRPIMLSGTQVPIWTGVYADVPKPQLLTTVAIPVVDKRNTSAQQAKLLGVAGVDVPVEEFMKLTPAYKLGVNGYSFAITNNGYVLYHPDLRPRFGEFLKPGYTNVDLAEVELVVQEKKSPWEFDQALLAMRKTMIDRKIGWNPLEVKIHFDDMKRVVTRNNSYYYGPIENTPFSLAISLPEPYGHYRVVGQNEVKTLKEDWMDYFRGNNWRVHPDWVYCDLGNKSENLTPEQVIEKFLTETLSTQQFRWRTTSAYPTVIQNPTCEKDLIQSLVFDAKVTNVDTKKCAPPKIPSEYETSMIKMYGVMTTFVATRSGLLRVEDHLSEEERANVTEKPFKDIHTRAIDELFYRRAVDFYTVNSSAFVFSVPHDAGNRKNVKVTGSHAIFLGSGKKMAPAAVVGLEFNYTLFSQQFIDTTSKCMQTCRYKCEDEELDCYLLDNNGFVVVSENHKQTGKFFGEIDFTLFDSMIKSGIYKRVHLYDYQAICIEPDKSKDTAGFLLTPFHHLRSALSWMWSKLAMFLVNYSLYGLWSHDGIFASGFSFGYSDRSDDVLEETTFRPCEKEVYLYEMQKRDSDDPIKGRLSMCHQTGCHKQFIVQYVPYTNLLMLVVYTSCPCETSSVKLSAEKYQPNSTLQCNHMKNGLYRERPILCVNYHAGERDIQECGKGSSLSSSIFLSLIAFVLSRHVLI